MGVEPFHACHIFFLRFQCLHVEELHGCREEQGQCFTQGSTTGTVKNIGNVPRFLFYYLNNQNKPTCIPPAPTTESPTTPAVSSWGADRKTLQPDNPIPALNEANVVPYRHIRALRISPCISSSTCSIKRRFQHGTVFHPSHTEKFVHMTYRILNQRLCTKVFVLDRKRPKVTLTRRILRTNRTGGNEGIHICSNTPRSRCCVNLPALFLDCSSCQLFRTRPH